MPNQMQTLVRGGQTTVHSVRMLKQVIRTLLKTAICILIIYGSLQIYQKTNFYNFKAATIVTYAEILVNYQQEDHLI